MSWRIVKLKGGSSRVIEFGRLHLEVVLSVTVLFGRHFVMLGLRVFVMAHTGFFLLLNINIQIMKYAYYSYDPLVPLEMP
jgi:hypothetical protein